MKKVLLIQNKRIFDKVFFLNILLIEKSNNFEIFKSIFSNISFLLSIKTWLLNSSSGLNVNFLL